MTAGGGRRGARLGALTATLGCLAALAAPALAQAGPGQLDPSFASGGRLVQAGGVRFKYSGRAIGAERPGGGAVVSSSGVLFSYLPDGSPDPAFGSGGQVSTSPYGFTASAIAVDSSGRIVLVGGALTTGPPRSPSIPGTEVVVERYLPDGRLDPSFADKGVLQTDLGLPPPTVDPLLSPVITANRPLVAATEVAIDSAGRIVVGGNREAAIAMAGPQEEAFLTRLGSDGAIDQSFGGGGLLRLGQPTALEALALDSSSGIYVEIRAAGTSSYRVLLAHLNSSGALDPGFGQDGWRRFSSTTAVAEPAAGIAIDPQGRLLSAGTRLVSFIRGGQTQTAPTPYVERLLANGRTDRSFGRKGFAAVRAPFNPGAPLAIAVDSAGGILLGGSTRLNKEIEPFTQRFVLTRLRPKGAIDTGFGRGGFVSTGFGRTAGANFSTLWVSGSTASMLGTDTNPKLSGGGGFAISRYALGG